MNSPGRLIVVSNRLPVSVEGVGDDLHLKPSGGGLVSAMVPILNKSGGCWIGWPGNQSADVAPLLKGWCARENYSFLPVFLTEAERDTFYRGYSNEIIWPLFHGLPSLCSYGSSYWGGYCDANLKFAKAIERAWQPGDSVWIHDYHLMILAETLRKRGFQDRLAYFHHIPFPPPEIFRQLPWSAQILRALLRFNVIGFQTALDQRNFVACLENDLPQVRVDRLGNKYRVRLDGESSTVGTYPISIDYNAFTTLSGNAPVQPGVSGETSILLGVDRLDYTKGVPERLIAFRQLLARRPDLCGNVTLKQVVVPSREDIPEYLRLKLRIEKLVTEINLEYGKPGWMPIQYQFRSISRDELLAFYRSANVALVTPLKDGMNLVAKEYCASRLDNLGVLILSEFAGAAEELKRGAILVNPYDTEEICAAIAAALAMPRGEQRVRMHLMRSHLSANDVFRWSRSFTADMMKDDPDEMFEAERTVQETAR